MEHLHHDPTVSAILQKTVSAILKLSNKTLISIKQYYPRDSRHKLKHTWSFHVHIRSRCVQLCCCSPIPFVPVFKNIQQYSTRVSRHLLRSRLIKVDTQNRVSKVFSNTFQMSTSFQKFQECSETPVQYEFQECSETPVKKNIEHQITVQYRDQDHTKAGLSFPSQRSAAP